VNPERLEALLEILNGVRRPSGTALAPTDAEHQPRGSAGFHRRSYWREPAWLVSNWLLWWLLRAGESERAERLWRTALMQLADGRLRRVLRSLQRPVPWLHRAVLDCRCPNRQASENLNGEP
jgi:hypothetical protein